MYPLYFLLRFVLMCVHWRRSRVALKAIRRYDSVQKELDRVKHAHQNSKQQASYEENAVHFVEVARLKKELDAAEEVWARAQKRADSLAPARARLANWRSLYAGGLMGAADAAKVGLAWYYWADVCSAGLYMAGAAESAWSFVQNLF